MKYSSTIALILILSSIIIGCGEEEAFIEYQPQKRPVVLIEGTSDETRKYIPKGGVVSDEITAIKLAEVIWYSDRGAYIYTRFPFVATLEDDTIWCVEGRGGHRNECGPALTARISKNDGRILELEY